MSHYQVKDTKCSTIVTVKKRDSLNMIGARVQRIGGGLGRIVKEVTRAIL